MTETIRFGRIYLEDLMTGTGTDNVSLADGSVAALTKINLSSLGGAGGLDFLDLIEQSSAPATPGSSVARVYRKSDNKQYLKDDAGTELEWPFTVGTITSGVWNGTAVAVGYGGTGLASYVVGDLIYASATTTLAKLAAVVVGQVLISAGIGIAPAWSAAPTLTTSITSPVVIGGVAVTSKLSLRSTSGAGSSDAIMFQVGNNGATEAARFTTEGILAHGTAFTTGAVGGDLVMANTKKLLFVNALGNTLYNVLTLDANNVFQIAFSAASGAITGWPAIPYIANASFPAGTANGNGIVGVDSTNNRLIYFSGGARYYIAGTSF